MNPINDFTVRTLSLREIEQIGVAYNKIKYSLNYQCSLFASVIIGITMIVNLVREENKLPVLILYCSVMFIAWVPCLKYKMLANKRIRYIRNGTITGVSGVCTAKKKHHSHGKKSHSYTVYTISTELSEIKTFRYNDVYGKRIEVGDRFYLLRTSRHDTFFLKI